jgi:hypothetical protein
MRTTKVKSVVTAGCLMLAFCLTIARTTNAQGCADDTDGDGTCDVDDNCVSVANPDQLDTYGDATGPQSGDACEPFNDRLNVTKLKVRAGATGASKGRVAVKGDFILHAGETFTGAAGIAVRVADALTLDENVPGLAGPVVCTTANRAIRCKGSSPLFAGNFKFGVPNTARDVLVRYTFKITKRSIEPLFDAPIGVTLTDLTNDLELQGHIGDCALANGSITCREF